MLQRAKQPRAVFWHNHEFCVLTPPLMMGVKNDANETREGSICVKYISRVDVEVM